MVQNSTIPAIKKNPYGSNYGQHCKETTKQKFVEKLKSYQNDKDLDENETKSCFLFAEDIKYLLAYYSDPQNLNGEKPIEGFRIYFFREDENRPYSYPGQKIQKLINGNKTQMSIIVVPVNNYQYPNLVGTSVFTADDMFNKDDECLVLTPGGETTGLCPTNCPR